jgi:hypothetical protein
MNMFFATSQYVCLAAQPKQKFMEAAPCSTKPVLHTIHVNVIG